MRIAFDGIALADQPLTGVGRAFLNGLLAYLDRGDAAVLLLLPAGAPAPALPGIEIAVAPRGAWRRQLRLPALLRRLGADLLHSPVAAVPLVAPCPTIATVHDLPWLEPAAGETTGLRRRLATRLALTAAAAVIAPSAATASAAARLCRPAKIRHIPHGSRRADPPPPLAARRGPLLVLGDARPRKNRDRVRAAHAALASSLPDLPPLSFCGPPDAYVDEARKGHLLRTCRAVVQCSLYEGFGLPVLEAMAHAAPLLCADIPPFRELAGDAALFVDPRDEAAIAAGIARILEPAVAAQLAQRGWQRAGRFSAAATAAAWAALHAELVQA